MLLVRLPCPHHCRCPGFPQGSYRWPLLAVRPRSRAVKLPREQRLAVRPCSRAVTPPRVQRLAVRLPAPSSPCRRPSHRHLLHPTRHLRLRRCLPWLWHPCTNCVALWLCGRHRHTSTSAVIASEGRTSGTSSQPSSVDHAGKAESPTAGRPTHFVGHLVVAALSSASLCPRRPHRPVLLLCHGGRICYFDRQQHVRSCPLSCWLQRHHWQVDLQAEVQLQWYTETVQGLLSSSRLHPATQRRLR
jgi:hypothetical protein